MAAVAREESPGHYSGAPQGPCQERNLECDPHDEKHRHEIVHIGVERDGVGDVSRELVSGEETQGQREDEVIGRGHPEIEEHDAGDERRRGVAPFVGVKGG